MTSYQVLARKWRPKYFSELVGQEHVVAVLTNALRQQRLHHAYLFTGTRGVGKTTIARIFAKSLNCESGVTATPCGQCDACVDIDQGRFVDLLEIDAASRTKVDDTREILDNVQYAPTRGRYKVYLIDEVHMLSRSSFNALLKTLEEPPEHVKFILATTDPQKLPVTVLSRCLQFHLKALTVKQIEHKLTEILTSESVDIEAFALTLLAKAAQGSMRDSLSLTDQAIAQGQGSISTANVQQMLGGVDHHWVYKILIALVKQDSKGLMALSLEIGAFSPNYGRLLAELIQLLHQVAMTQVVGNHFELIPEHEVLLKKFCQAMSPEDVQLYYQIALNGRKDLPYASDEQSAFDMILLRLLAFKPQNLFQPIEQSETEPNVEFGEVELPHTDVTVANRNLENKQSTTQHSINKNEQAEIEQNDTELAAIETTAGISNLENQQNDKEKIQTENVEEDIEDDVLRTLNNELKEIETHANSLNVQQNNPNDTNSSTLPSEAIPEQLDKQSVAPTAPLSSIDADKNSQIQESLIEENKNELSNNQASLSAEPANPMISNVLANRNMLRSKKQALESNEKKSSGATERLEQPATPIKDKPKDIPDIESISEQPFSEDVIDPSVIKKANQVDKWANMIDAMALNGRLRQLALNATIDPDTSEEHLILALNQSTKHLQSDAAMEQLNQFVSEYFGKTVNVEVKVVEETCDDPAQIQSKINDKRYGYAKELLHNDDIVVAMKAEFQAELDEESIEAR